MRRGGVREAGAAPRGEGTGPHSAKTWTPASCPCNAQPSSQRVHGRLKRECVGFQDAFPICYCLCWSRSVDSIYWLRRTKWIFGVELNVTKVFLQNLGYVICKNMYEEGTVSPAMSDVTRHRLYGLYGVNVKATYSRGFYERLHIQSIAFAVNLSPQCVLN